MGHIQTRDVPLCQWLYFFFRCAFGTSEKILHQSTQNQLAGLIKVHFSP